jgi:hypothetical protein
LGDESATSAELAFNVEVEADRVRNVTQALIIGAFVAIPGLIAVYPDVPSWKAAMIVIAGLLAGGLRVFSDTVELCRQSKRIATTPTFRTSHASPFLPTRDQERTSWQDEEGAA